MEGLDISVVEAVEGESLRHRLEDAREAVEAAWVAVVAAVVEDVDPAVVGDTEWRVVATVLAGVTISIAVVDAVAEAGVLTVGEGVVEDVGEGVVEDVVPSAVVEKAGLKLTVVGAAVDAVVVAALVTVAVETGAELVNVAGVEGRDFSSLAVSTWPAAGPPAFPPVAAGPWGLCSLWAANWPLLAVMSKPALARTSATIFWQSCSLKTVAINTAVSAVMAACWSCC